MYKLVCIDMDGTLLNSKFEISKEDILSIKKVVHLGVKIAIVTGRPYNVAEYFKSIIDEDIYIIGTNGTYFECDNFVYNKLLNAKQMEEIYNAAEKYKLTAHFKGKNILISNKVVPEEHPYKKINPLLDQSKKIEIHENICLEDIGRLNKNNINKCIVLGDDLEAISKGKDFCKGLEGFEVVSSNKRNFEVMLKDSSKGVAIKELAKILNVGMEEVVAIGDNENDISMFKEAAYCVAMGNAPDDIKNMANLVTKSNEDSGVGYALNKIFA